MSETQPSDKKTESEVLLAKSFVIEQGKESFEFSIPTIQTSMKLGVRARAIRRSFDPQSFGEEAGLDNETVFLAWGAAAFETLLVACDAEDNWPFSPHPATKSPVVDYTKFPDTKLDVVLEVSQKLWSEWQRFRALRAASGRAAGEKTLDGSENTGA